MDEATRRSQETWSAGDFGSMAGTMLAAELLCEAVPIKAGQRVLDVAAGSGNAAIAAAKRGADVVGADFVPGLLDLARERAAVERLKKIRFEVGDTSSLPFAEAEFDVVLSTFGHMFAPDPSRAVDEMVRVCKPGGKIGFVAWSPNGLFGRFFRTHDKYNPPAAGVADPVLWGDEEIVRERFGSRGATFHLARRMRMFRAPSAQAWFDNASKFLGPTVVAMGMLDEARQRAFAAEIVGMMADANESGDDTLLAPAEYLEAVVTLRS